MAVYIPITEAQDMLDELVDRAIAGEEVVLTENGRPVARLDQLAESPTAEDA